jgi:hypothetical protein
VPEEEREKCDAFRFGGNVVKQQEAHLFGILSVTA